MSAAQRRRQPDKSDKSVKVSTTLVETIPSPSPSPSSTNVVHAHSHAVRPVHTCPTRAQHATTPSFDSDPLALRVCDAVKALLGQAYRRLNKQRPQEPWNLLGHWHRPWHVRRHCRPRKRLGDRGEESPVGLSLEALKRIDQYQEICRAGRGRSSTILDLGGVDGPPIRMADRTWHSWDKPV